MMTMTRRWMMSVAALACLAGGAAIARTSQGQTETARKDTRTTRATGTFDVKLTPQSTDESKLLGRMAIDKQFHGDLEGTSKGEMLTAGTDVKDSAGYVAIERVSGKLQGRSGAFILQHTGTMNRGQPSLSVSVVPDSGTGELKGLSGTMTIDIGGGKHAYVFEYRIESLIPNR
jgi:hypothetical protein